MARASLRPRPSRRKFLAGGLMRSSHRVMLTKRRPGSEERAAEQAFGEPFVAPWDGVSLTGRLAPGCFEGDRTLRSGSPPELAHDEVSLPRHVRGRGSRARRKDAVPREFQRSSRVHGYDLSVRTERCAVPKDDLNGRVQDDPGKLTRTTAVARVRGGASTPGGLASLPSRARRASLPHHETRGLSDASQSAHSFFP